MATDQNGLRFDIYERVHLSEGVLGIKELESVELVPHIQVLSQGEQAVLRGNLLLTGAYVDEQGREAQTLEHLIPVEITLPMNRVQRVEDIAVEIENFDVDLLSERSLNITGVLSLNGLEVFSSSEGERSWSETEEEVVFVHEARVPQREAAAEPWAEEQAERVAEREPSILHSSAAEPASPFTSRQEERQNGWTPEEPRTEASEKASVQSVAAAEPALAPESAQLEQHEQPAQPAEEKKDVKVGFGIKGSSAVEPSPAPAQPASGKPFGFTSLVQYAASKSEAREAEEA
ncbi:hypothetical protein P9314_26850, partial [Paenibacillus validus]|nr:hypothetical protein [Paenibacillus validus]